MNTKNFYSILCALGLLCVLGVSCSQDDGNYDYLADEEVSKITVSVDSLLTPNLYQFSSIMTGTEVDIHMKADYAYADRLQWRWFYLKSNYNQYRAEQVGNAMVYPPADTISNERDLNWKCDLKPGTYKLYCMAQDPENGMKAYWTLGSYIVVTSAGQQGGLYMLTERDGGTDIEVFTSGLMLIYGGQQELRRYYSSTHDGQLLEGKPKFIQGSHAGKASKEAYLVATDKNLYRLNADGLTTMQTWEDMFYTTPAKFNPQKSFFTNSCEFLLNDGKMHVIYANHPNDMKFSEPVAGDYDAWPFLMLNTLTTWRPVEGAIDAWQVLYDAKHKAFKPYFSGSTQLSAFKSTVDSAYVDANKVPGDVKAVFQGGGNYTCVITYIGGKPYLYRYCFYNRVDNGDLSAEGARSVIDLSGCEDIQNATMFASNTSGFAFYYATPKGVFSFSASSGEKESKVVYACEDGEEISCIYAWGSAGGGWPTSDCAFFIGVWNEGKKDGKLVQYEVDVNYGTPNSMWGPMFGAPDNPVVTTGWGKIVDMTCLDAE